MLKDMRYIGKFKSVVRVVKVVISRYRGFVVKVITNDTRFDFNYMPTFLRLKW